MKARGLSTEAVYTSCDSDITVLSRTGCVGLSGPRVTLGRGWVCTLTLVPGNLSLQQGVHSGPQAQAGRRALRPWPSCLV